MARLPVITVHHVCLEFVCTKPWLGLVWAGASLPGVPVVLLADGFVAESDRLTIIACDLLSFFIQGVDLTVLRGAVADVFRGCLLLTTQP